MLRRLILVTVVLGASSFGCGGLREQPIFPDGGSTSGAGGEGPGTGGSRGGSGGTAGGRGGSGGTGAVAGSGGVAGTGGVAGRGGTGGTAGGGEVGTHCTAAAGCASGFCVDGVCCESACTGSCWQCNLAGFEGRCIAVAANLQAPSGRPACAKAATSTCMQNGFCDGKGACQLYPSGTVCGSGTCNTTTQMAVTMSVCDGEGSCKPTNPVTCAPFKCAQTGGQCSTTCVTDNDCQGQPCVNGSCGKVGNGSKCTSAGQCTSGSCVDGVCCDSACGGSCQACDLAGSIGHCTTLPAGQAPPGTRTACVAGTCGSACDGTGTSCVFASTSVACGAASCTDGTVTSARKCDGKGACTTATMTSCNGFACSGTGCRTTCTGDNQCASTKPYCVSGSCVAKKPLGTVCGAGSECTSGNCVDGVCCSSTKCGACMACNLATPGTCSNRAAGAVDSACGATPAACETGTCNGSGACRQASDGTTCGAQKVCHSGTCGSCVAMQPCNPTNKCKTGTTSCSTGVSRCVESGNQAEGTACGVTTCPNDSLITPACDGMGACVDNVMLCPSGNCRNDGTDCAGQSGTAGTTGTLTGGAGLGGI